MARRLEIAEELESYLDEIMDRVDDCIRDQEEDRIREISRINLHRDAMYQSACDVMEFLYFEDRLSATKALKDAAQLTIDAAIYAHLNKNRALDALTRDEEDDMLRDYEFVSSIIDGDNRGGRRSGGRGTGRDSRQEAASSARRNGREGRDGGRTGRSDRSGRGRDDNDRGERGERLSRDEERRLQQEEEQRRAEERKQARGNSTRDAKVETAQQGLDANKVVTTNVMATNPGPFCSPDKQLPLAPVYWLGSQITELVDNQVKVSIAGENVDYDRHRTDLYLAVRKSVKPSASLRDDALSKAIAARQMYVKEVIEKIEEDGNVVDEKVSLQFTQVKTEESYIGKYYGEGSPLAKINAGLDAYSLRALPGHPLTMRIETYPLWVMNSTLTAAVEELCAATSLNDLMTSLIRVSNECDPVQWKYFHDQTTLMINKALKVELEVRPYLQSLVTEWDSFAKWIDGYRNGELISWFGNNLQTLIRRTFHVYKHGSPMAHTFVDGTLNKFASVSATERLIYIPVDSENFGAASVTKLGRVLESATPKLYQLLSDHVDVTARETRIVTTSDESVEAHRRVTSLTNSVIFLGDVNWC